MNVVKPFSWIYKKFSSVYILRSENEKGFYDDTRWMRRMNFFFGVLPIYREKSGNISYKYLSPKMFYSVVISTALIILSFKTIFMKRLAKLITLWNDFDSFLYNLMFMSFSKIHFLYTFGGWFALKEMALYHNMWTDFEKLYKRKMKRILVLNTLETYSNRVVIICLTSGICLTGGQLFLLPTYTFEEFMAYIPSIMCTFLYIGIILINCFALERTAAYLLEQLKRDLQRVSVTQDIIILHNKLWVDLSNITQQFGVAFFNFNFVVLVGNIIDLIISGYGYLSVVLRKFKTNTSVSMADIPKEEFGLGVAAFCSLALIVVIANCCHYVTHNLTTQFVDELCMATTHYHHPKVNKQIDLFLLSIKNNPPVITLGGYVDIDRSFISKVISIVMTYYVVLIQFEISFNGWK